MAKYFSSGLCTKKLNLEKKHIFVTSNKNKFNAGAEYKVFLSPDKMGGK